jgi:hypothetical protein
VSFVARIRHQDSITQKKNNSTQKRIIKNSGKLCPIYKKYPDYGLRMIDKAIFAYHKIKLSKKV